MLELKNITKTYNSGAGAQKALDNVSISFAGHEFVSILGASGSGCPRVQEYEGSLVRLRCEAAVSAGPGQRWE